MAFPPSFGLKHSHQESIVSPKRPLEFLGDMCICSCRHPEIWYVLINDYPTYVGIKHRLRVRSVAFRSLPLFLVQFQVRDPKGQSCKKLSIHALQTAYIRRNHLVLYVGRKYRSVGQHVLSRAQPETSTKRKCVRGAV